MNNMHRFAVTLLLFFFSATIVPAENSTLLRYPIPSYGTIQFNVPNLWKNTQQSAKDASPTILFEPKSGPSFQILVTPLFDPPMPKTEKIRAIVQRAAEKAGAQAVEKKINLIELKGNSGTGYFFSATDSAPKPGEYKCLTQGMIPVGETILWFTILTNDGQQLIIKEALSMLKTAMPPLTNIPTTISIPGEGWAITFKSPELMGKEESNEQGNYAFRATSARFNISFFVEKPQGKGQTNEDCYRFYWPKASSNPQISKESIATSHTLKYYRVQYDLIDKFQGRTIIHRNVNYYFAFQGRWVDVHISIYDPTEEDKKIFETFDKTLTYEKKLDPPDKAKPQTV